MKLNRDKVDLILARKKMSVAQLSEKYGCSRQSMYTTLNGRRMKPEVIGRIADALGVDVTEIIE